MTQPAVGPERARKRVANDNVTESSPGRGVDGHRDHFPVLSRSTW